MTAPDVGTVAAVIVGALGCALDLRTRRIPNSLTLGSAVVAFAVLLATAGVKGLGLSLSGWLVGVLVFLPFFLLGGMGAGDVKLLGAVGAWLGPVAVLWSALYAAIAGGVLALLVSLYLGYLRQALLNLGAALLHWGKSGPRPFPGLTLATAKGPRLPYALPILIGMVAALWLR